MDHHKRILQVAAHLISERGYKGVSLQSITNIVGIHKSTLFHYFRNKEQIMTEIIDLAYEELVENIFWIFQKKDLAPEEKLRLAMIGHITSLAKSIDNVNVFISEMRYLSHKNRKKYLEIRKKYERGLIKIIDEIKETNRKFDGMDSKIVAYAIFGMCNGVGRWYKKNGKLQAEEIANIFYQMIVGI